MLYEFFHIDMKIHTYIYIYIHFFFLAELSRYSTAVLLCCFPKHWHLPPSCSVWKALGSFTASAGRRLMSAREEGERPSRCSCCGHFACSGGSRTSLQRNFGFLTTCLHAPPTPVPPRAPAALLIELLGCQAKPLRLLTEPVENDCGPVLCPMAFFSRSLLRIQL